MSRAPHDDTAARSCQRSRARDQAAENGKGFTYTASTGKLVRDRKALERIKRLIIPPAWTDVWFSGDQWGHIQATGRDARGRKQYIYHPAFRAHREEQKYDHLIEFAKSLPALRRTILRHMSLRGLPREKVLATIVYLLETTLIRVGNEDYARANQSFGLTTLRTPHVDIAGSALRFNFKGKSGRTWRLKVTDRRVAKIVKSCQELPGQHLFQYGDEKEGFHQVTSTDVNAYLREITGRDVTAKDFRTWSGTVLAALALCGIGDGDALPAIKRNLRAAILRVSERLGNTTTICRKCYVHPAVLQKYQEGKLALDIKPRAVDEIRPVSPRLRPEEAAVLSFLQQQSKAAFRALRKQAA
jgi:DNA topoisomerase-1